MSPILKCIVYAYKVEINVLMYLDVPIDLLDSFDCTQEYSIYAMATSIMVNLVKQQVNQMTFLRPCLPLVFVMEKK